jgi:predicted RND superfamily exporter protein
MQVLFAKMSHARKEELLRFVQHYVGTVHPDYDVRFAGPLFVYHSAEREGISGIVQGAGLDLLLILATFAVVFRRAWATISAVLVNLTPVLVLLGAMALAGVPWSLGLLGLPVVVLGLAVDDTVHLLWEARARTGRRPLGALLSAMRRNAGAVLSTCALLAGCLGALARSGFQVNHELGILLPLGLGLALFAELTLLPALLGLGLRAPRRRSARSSW